MPAFQFHTWQDLKSQQLARSETSKPSKAKLLKDKESENISGNVHFLKNILYLMDCIHFMVYHHFFFRRMRRAGRSTVRWMSSGSTCRSTSWKTSWSGRSRSARPSTTSCSRHSTTWSRTIEVLLPLFYHSTWNTSLLHRQLYSWVIFKHIWDGKILYSI